MIRASIFISHSAKDGEQAPDDATDGPAMTRWRRLRLARALRTAIEKELRALGSVEVWLDRRQLQPGDPWRDALHTELARCQGAVLLLTPEALESGWVLKEATILTWLKALGCPLRLVPVLVEVHPEEDLPKHGFGPLCINEIQAHKVAAEALDPDDEASITACAAAVAERFRDVVGSTSDSGLDIWASRLTANWGELDRPFLRAMMTTLGMGEAGWPESSFDRLLRPAHGIACELLLRTWRETVDVLETLHLLPVRWDQVKKLVQPLWVPAAAAAVLPHVAARPPGQRVILVRGSEPRTGGAVVQRAYFGAVPGNRLQTPDDSAGSEAELVARLVELMRSTRVPEPNFITAEKPYFMVLGGSAATPGVVHRLRTTPGYEAVTYVVMAEDDRASLLGLDPPLIALDPDLAVDGEQQARDFAVNLNMIAEGGP